MEEAAVQTGRGAASERGWRRVLLKEEGMLLLREEEMLLLRKEGGGRC